MRKINKIHIAAAAVIGLLVFLNWFKLIPVLEFYSGRIFSPVFALANSWSLKIGSVYVSRADKESLQSELALSREELNGLRAENAMLRVVEDENRALRELLQFTEESGYGYIISRVISRGSISDVSGQTEAIIINRGRRDGVVEGSAVVDKSGVFVGKVTGLKEASAQVDILYSRRCKVAASPLDFPGTGGVVAGELGLSALMSMIPQDADINIGDTIITSGLEEAIPRGLAIGRVIGINKENNELWQAARLEPFFSIADLLIVAVIKP